MGWFSKKKDPPKEEPKQEKKVDESQKKKSANKQPEELAMQYQTNQDQFIQDSILQFITSPLFTSPVLDFLDENCIIFQDDSKESMKLYQDIHLNFKSHVEQQMMLLQETIGLNKKSLFDHIQTMLSVKNLQKYLKMMILYFHFGEFTKIMISRNKKLEDMAKQGVTPQQHKGSQKQYESVSKEDMNFVYRQSLLDDENLKERQKLLKQREDDEYERAILESKKWYEDYLRRLEQEEEDLRRALLLSLEFMKQQGLKESEQDKKERLDQERKLQEEKERARQEIKRLELENERLQKEKLKRLQELEQEKKRSELEESQLMKSNQQKLQAIELEKQRQQQLQEEERRLRELNEQKQREQEEMKRKILENQERVRKMKEEEMNRKKLLEEQQERQRQQKIQEEQNQKKNESDKKDQTNSRQVGAIKQQLYGNQLGNNQNSYQNKNLEQELGYNYDDDDYQNNQNDIMNQYASQGGQGIQDNLLLVSEIDDNKAQQRAAEQRQNLNNYSSNQNNATSYQSNNPNANKYNNSKNQGNNGNLDYQFEDDSEDSNHLGDYSSQNPHRLNPKTYDQEVRKNFFADLQHDSRLQSQLQSQQHIQVIKKQGEEEEYSNGDEDKQNYKTSYKNDNFEDLYKEINDLDMDDKYDREQLDDSRKIGKQKQNFTDDLYNPISQQDSQQRRDKAAQQRAELIKMRKMQRENELQEYQSIKNGGEGNQNNYQSNNQSYGNQQNNNNFGYQYNNDGNMYAQQGSLNQNTNGMYGINRTNSNQQGNLRDDSYGVQRDQRVPVKFSDIGKATIQNRVQF